MKKNLFFLSIALFFFTFTHAQISKGSIWLGGNIGYNGSKDGQTGTKQSLFYFSPGIGTAVKENLILGIQLDFSKSKFENGGDQTGSAYGADLFLRKYWTIVKRLYVFGHFQGGYRSTKDESEYTNYHKTVNGDVINLGVSPGLAFSINRKIQLESKFNNLFFVSYNKTKTNQIVSGTETSFDGHSFSGGINLENAYSLNLGVRFLLGK